MLKYIVAIIALLSLSNVSFGSMLTFDDISPGSINTYGGLTWTNIAVLDATNYPYLSGYSGGLVSGDHVAYNAYAAIGITQGPTFDFNSVYLAAAWNNGLQVTVEGYLLGSLQYAQTVSLLNASSTPGSGTTKFVFNYLGIDELRLNSFGGTGAGFEGSGEHFAMDNFELNAPAGTVPEPTSIVVWGLGIGLAGFVRQRRKSSIAVVQRC